MDKDNTDSISRLIAVILELVENTMARTKQTARKSTGGRAPRKQLEGKDNICTFLDHTQQLYTVVNGRSRSSNPNVIRKLSIHLYFLNHEVETTQRQAIGESLLASDTIAGWGNARNYWPRIDVYAPLSSIDECIEHHRREKAYRRKAVEEMHRAAADAARNACGPEVDEDDREEAAREAVLALRGKEVFPHIVPTWCYSAKFWNENSQFWSGGGDRYRSFILVIPENCRSWDDVLQKGIYLVKFDQDVTPAMETIMYDEEDEDSLLENDRSFWVYIEKIDNGPPVQIKRLSVGDDINEMAMGSSRPSDTESDNSEIIKGHLFHRWVDYTSALNDCTYRIPACDGCDTEEPHDCEIELNEHYFDEDGQCIACRRSTEFRRRSKRISKKRKTSNSAES